MTRDDVIRMAREAGMCVDMTDMGAASLVFTVGCHGISRGQLEAFAALVAAAEREACARLCEGIANVCTASSIGKQRQGGVSAANGCAEMIRMRGKA